MPVREEQMVLFLVFEEILGDYKVLQPVEFFTGIIL